MRTVSNLMNPGDSFRYVVKLNDVDHVEVDDVEHLGMFVVRDGDSVRK
jgi:hypothetical protein